MASITKLLAGAVVFMTVGSIFWYLLPRNGTTYRLAGTEWEPYVGVAFTAGIALSFTMILSGIIDIWG